MRVNDTNMAISVKRDHVFSDIKNVKSQELFYTLQGEKMSVCA